MIQESIENYLETIYMLSVKRESVRSVDIATEMGYSKPTISVVMKKLKEQNYVTVDEKSGIVTLSEDAVKIARGMYERHVLLTEVLVKLGVSSATAQSDACKIEHDLSDETYECIKKHFSSSEENR